MLHLDHVTGGYGPKPVIHDLSLTVEQGEFFTLLGPNGSGKSTLFKLISGTLPLSSGSITMDQEAVNELPPAERARKIAVLSQEATVSFDFTVEEIVSLGRYAFQHGLFKSLSKRDKEMIEHALKVTDTTIFRNRPFRTLSGGEKQRVLLAKSLAQEPKLLLLDEPTNHLDIRHAFQLLDLLKDWQKSHQLSVFAILHDLNVASLYADRVGLLNEGRLVTTGSPDILRKEEQLASIYEVKINAQSHPVMPKPQITITPGHASHSGSFQFGEDVTISRSAELIRVSFDLPLRTISSGVTGDGIGWMKHFCNFHVDPHYDGVTPLADMTAWLSERRLSPDNTVGMMTAVHLDDAATVKETIDGIDIMVLATAGIGNAVDITLADKREGLSHIGTLNIMVFIDAHLTDGALVNAMMSATEAKTKALQDLEVTDRFTGTLATGTPTDSLAIGTTQNGDLTPFAGSGTPVGKAIGATVYKAVTEAIKHYLRRSAP
ncbi:adenosylcobinamide amidohydrolase [Salisediminibacterium beveridgei]|uniref:Vitamin B12 ABC transporter, ATPase component BtuD / Adenosylcobinamide amidohydrolase n=1 Tax=Salisediminibacterium beveridgei TaxID=632773 RepID=A0A1D7QXT9_9BACI|nr:adenosylcobinamide amidohydrolase [Salisediminibacterium beveridgei]AOM83823.1 Vitamin B12 ABC transporter, ATPase component BtuD / Adenosylcobinamide amidohydrolase [Salisediminibacterium beveridgei]